MTPPSLLRPRLLRLCLSPLLLLGAVLALSGCSTTKTVPKGDALFASYTVKVKDQGDSSNRQTDLETELSAVVRPEPNASILGLKPKLWIYNAFYTTKEKGIKHWIMTKLGEPPVLFSALDTGTVSSIMSARLDNRGYFKNSVSSTATIQNKKATVEWTATVGEPYRIRNIAYTLNDSLPVLQAISETRSESLLQPGKPYDLSTMTAERTRIDQVLKNKGYYYFSPEYLIFSADSTVGDRKVDVLLRLKSTAPQQALYPYTLDDVSIFANYSVSDKYEMGDTINVRGYHYIPDENYVKGKHLLRSVFIHSDSLYRRENNLLTTKRLMGLPAYKFANIKYERDTTKLHQLDASIYLTPAMKKSLRAQVQMVSKSNNFVGPGVTVSFRNRNTFKGSELLSVEVSGNFETQTGGRVQATSESTSTPSNTNLTSYELQAQANLTFPRIISPFRLHNLRSQYVPKTKIGLGFDFLNRVQYFQLNSFNATYGYSWKPSRTLTLDATPINLQFVQLLNPSDEFKSILNDRPYLQRSFDNQFIIGSIYQLTYSTQEFTDRTHQFYDDVTLDISGNSLNALETLAGQTGPTDEEPRTIFGQPYSQYSRISNDFRYYFNFGKESQLVARLVAGVGFPYGNSSTLPYAKQFSVGGPNSIRAFRARSIGPGTYDVVNELANDSLALSYFDQVGDMQLQTNLEYRFPIFGFFKGAVFVDAGNVWLLKDYKNADGEIDRPGGKFEPNNFLSQLAIGTGFGLRVDIQFFVIRVDIGIPVQVPYLPKGERYVLDDFQPTFSGRNSMVLNIAIGYPF